MVGRRTASQIASPSRQRGRPQWPAAGLAQRLRQIQIKDSPAREGRNPATGAAMQIAASRKLTFAPAHAVKDKLNG